MLEKNLINFIQDLFVKYKHIWTWWPWESRVEIMVSAVLTQLSKRQQVSRVLDNLKKNRRSSEEIGKKISHYDCNINLDWNIEKQIAEYCLNYLKEEDLKWVGFYKRKYQTIIELLKWFIGLDLDVPTLELRKQLLNIKGIWKETADAILCYWLDKPSFVIDLYTYKVLYKNIFRQYYKDFKFFKKDYSYDKLQNLIENILKDLKKDDIFWYKNLHWAFVEEWKKLNSK